MDAVGLVPPPAPSPRPTAILSRPDHEEGDDDAPAWSSLASQGVKVEERRDDAEEEEEEEDEDEEDGEEDANGEETDDRTQKIGQRMDDNDATISLRGVDLPAGLTAASNGLMEEDAQSNPIKTADSEQTHATKPSMETS